MPLDEHQWHPPSHIREEREPDAPPLIQRRIPNPNDVVPLGRLLNIDNRSKAQRLAMHVKRIAFIKKAGAARVVAVDCKQIKEGKRDE